MSEKTKFIFQRACQLLIGGILTMSMVTQTANAAERTMVVLDGSGSMWGQINGKPKLEIARETLSKVLQGINDDMELGLVAYGHREKGNCADIELIVPAAAGTRARIIDEVNQLRFLGKTPLTEAVRMAAEELGYTEDRATVILITDGLETCNANVCETGKLLESQGVDFTTHVVGFGLSKEEGRQVACLAENTGGRYFSADDADSLVDALTETIAVPLPAVSLIAVDQNNQPLEAPLLNWSLLDESGAMVLETKSKSSLSTSLPVGDYKVLVSGEDASGGASFTVTDELNQQINVPVEVDVLKATIDAPSEAPAGSEFEITWTGPDHKNDYISIAEKSAKEGKYIRYEYTRKGSPLKLLAPDESGIYEVRYVLSQSKRTLASKEIKLTAVLAGVDGPAEVAAGSEFEVSWTGPGNKNDYITIVKAGAKEGKYGDYGYTRQGGQLTLRAPDDLGEYEIRYVLGQSKRTLASHPITLTAVQGSIEAPAEAIAGSQIEVSWTGPDNKSDYITIVKSGAKEGKYGDYEYTKRGTPLGITAPDDLGEYEIRYVLGQSKRTLASSKIKLLPLSATLTLSNTAVPGGEAIVEWTGPDYQGDYITIVEKGSPEREYNHYVNTKRGSPVTIKVPRALGTFEIRYIVGQSRRVLASLEVELNIATSGLKVSTPVTAGSVVEVNWTGPDNQDDYIEIVEAGAATDVKPVSAARTAQGSPLSLFAPETAGEYEVRYMMRSNKEILTVAPLIVE